MNIFRFKFQENVMDLISHFAKMHQYDERNTFKEEWNKWVKEHSVAIEEEITRLKQLGYNGNVEDKMFHAGRYYFRKKIKGQTITVGKTNPQKRGYISMNEEVLIAMDNHIRSFNFASAKPANGYNDFCKMHIPLLSTEIKRLYNISANISANIISSADIISKIKKTYKNRYFNITHQL